MQEGYPVLNNDGSIVREIPQDQFIELASARVYRNDIPLFNVGHKK